MIPENEDLGAYLTIPVITLTILEAQDSTNSRIGVSVAST